MFFCRRLNECMNVYCLVFSFLLLSSLFFTPYSPPLPFSPSLTRRVYRIADGNISNAKAYIELPLAAYRPNFFLSRVGRWLAAAVCRIYNVKCSHPHPPLSWSPLSRCGSVTFKGKRYSIVFQHSQAATLPILGKAISLPDSILSQTPLFVSMVW